MNSIKKIFNKGIKSLNKGPDPIEDGTQRQLHTANTALTNATTSIERAEREIKRLKGLLLWEGVDQRHQSDFNNTVNDALSDLDDAIMAIDQAGVKLFNFM